MSKATHRYIGPDLKADAAGRMLLDKGTEGTLLHAEPREVRHGLVRFVPTQLADTPLFIYLNPSDVEPITD